MTVEAPHGDKNNALPASTRPKGRAGARKLRLRYLCLQAAREGQASHAHVHEIVAGLTRRGWAVELIEPVYANVTTEPGLLAKLQGFLCSQLRLFLRGNRPDLFYIRAHFAALPASLVARLVGVPVVQEVNGLPEELVLSWPWTRRALRLFSWMSRVQIGWAQGVIAVTPGLKEWALQHTKARHVCIVPNGANVELFTPNAPRTVARPEYYVVFFGALARWQGIDTMLAASELPQWPSEVKLVIIGSGVEQWKVEQASTRNSRVLYLGRVKYQDIPGLVAGSISALVPKAGYESFARTGIVPLKLFEAMACGVPVIVTDFPGQADIVREHGCGLVIPPENPRGLAEAVATLWRDPELRIAMGRAGRQAVQREHSWDARARATHEFLMSVLEKQRQTQLRLSR